MKRIKFQLYAGMGGFPRGAMIAAVGGLVMVTTAGSAVKATLYNADGTSLANPVTLTAGGAEIYVANSVNSVDLFIQAPGGQFVTEYGFVPGGDSDIAVDVSNRNQVAVIPFSAANQTADATETNTGFTEPTNAVFTGSGTGIRVLTVDATETVDIGTLSTDSGDADGFVSAASVATAGDVPDTNGALVSTTVATTPAVTFPSAHVSGGKAITYTLSAGSDTAQGYAILPYILTA